MFLVRLLDFYTLIVFFYVVISWLFHFNILNSQNIFLWRVFESFKKLTDPPLNYIRKYLENSFPSHNIIGEELKVIDKKSEFTWIIDPIDGTKSYMSGRPLWGTMIGLLKNNEPIIGMVDFPELDQLWIGYKDKLILNGNDCNFLEKENLTLKNSIFASTAPELFEFLNLLISTP